MNEHKGIKPTYGRILIELVPPPTENMTKGGIWVPTREQTGTKLHEGIVRAVGPGNRDDKGKRIPMDVQFGDRVMINPYAGQTFKIDGAEYLLVQEGEVLARMKKARKKS